jgi:hypothetical protein
MKSLDVIPAKAGIQSSRLPNPWEALDPSLRWDDGLGGDGLGGDGLSHDGMTA